MSVVNVRKLFSVVAVAILVAVLQLLTISSMPSVQAAPAQRGAHSGSQFRFSGSSKCPSPPAGWDPSTATPDELRFYGLPRMPSHSGVAYANWLDEMHHAIQRVCGNETLGPRHDGRFMGGNSASNGDYWSGYIATSGGYNWASGYWTVPCYSGTNNSQRALQWIGIGGYGTPHLWQGGTESDHAQGYRFWYEAVVSSTSQIVYAGPAVTCGNSVSVQVDYNYTVAGNSYVYMANYTKGQYYSTYRSFTPSNNSAEWIVERTSCGTNLNYALAPTSQVPWSSAYAASTSVLNDAHLSISSFANQAVTMYQNSVLLSYPSSLSSGGTSFINYYVNSGVSYC